MNLLIWVCLAQAAWPSALAVYFTKTVEVFKPPVALRSNSYFGYSITYDEFNKRLVVSSPRENDIGEVYNCNIPAKTCATIAKDIKRASSNYTHDYWFGATVKAGRDFVMMCAPRFTEHTIRFNAYVTRGKCYTLQSNGNLFQNRIIDDNKRIQDSPSPMEATMDSFGWSIDVASDDSIMVGGPGMFHGRAMIYKGGPSAMPNFIRKSRSTPQFNFGYAVASGTFINKDLSFAVGSTYGKNGLGEVHFYKGLDFLLRLEKGVDKSDVGSMFGAVLCAAKLSANPSNLLTDLLVGAPTYASKSTYNLGAVYVYLAIKPAKSPVFKRKIVGQKSGSMFGSAIVNVGDLNNDKCHEIAIGAPFENDGHGVVYLYSGADLSSEKQDKALKPLQKIEPEAHYGESFGMSLTPLLDYDENGCKELAIGSPYKDTVVLLRCMASVIVDTKAIFPNVQGRTKTGITNFEFDVCLNVTYPSLPKNIMAEIITTVEMNHDDAKLLDPSGHFIFETSLHEKKHEYCKKVPFKLPPDGKYETAISYTVTSKLKPDLRTPPVFESSRVILSDRSILKLHDSLRASECAGDICVPILYLKNFISFEHSKDDPYIIGSSKVEKMTIAVLNTGEVAYDACVRVHIAGTNVLKPGGCVYETSTDGYSLKCEPSKPIRNSQTWSTYPIELDMVVLTNLHESINITMRLFNRCNQDNKHTQLVIKSIPLKADPRGITAKGETDIGPFVRMTEKDIKENGKKIKHVYTIMNNGPTNWEALPVDVTLLLQPYIKYDDAAVTVLTSTSNAYAPCRHIQENDTVASISYQCVVESLKTQGAYAKIIIPITILPGKLEGLLDTDKNVTIVSSIKLELIDGEYRDASTNSTITIQKAPVSLNTILIAVAVGLCILIVIALILYRIGFLQRKKREELQRLQKSVKRQTILRRSTMPSQSSARGSAEDRKQILNEMKEEDLHAPNLI